MSKLDDAKSDMDKKHEAADEADRNFHEVVSRQIGIMSLEIQDDKVIICDSPSRTPQVKLPLADTQAFCASLLDLFSVTQDPVQ